MLFDVAQPSLKVGDILVSSGLFNVAPHDSGKCIDIANAEVGERHGTDLLAKYKKTLNSFHDALRIFGFELYPWFAHSHTSAHEIEQSVYETSQFCFTEFFCGELGNLCFKNIHMRCSIRASVADIQCPEFRAPRYDLYGSEDAWIARNDLYAILSVRAVRTVRFDHRVGHITPLLEELPQ